MPAIVAPFGIALDYERTLPPSGVLKSAVFLFSVCVSAPFREAAGGPGIVRATVQPSYLYLRETEGYDMVDASGSVVPGAPLTIPEVTGSR